MNKIEKASEVKSTSIMLIIFGAIGILFLILYWLGVIDLNLSVSTKIMITIVLGIMFMTFFVLGIKSLSSHKKLLNEGVGEEKLKEEITAWIIKDINQEKIDNKIVSNFIKDEDIIIEDNDDKNVEETVANDINELTMEELYLERCKIIKAFIESRFMNLDDNLLDSIIENCYEIIFS